MEGASLLNNMGLENGSTYSVFNYCKMTTFCTRKAGLYEFALAEKAGNASANLKGQGTMMDFLTTEKINYC